MSPRGPVLALDYGTKRIGLAVSDSEGEFAFPVGELQRRNPKRDLEELAQLVRERGIVEIVVGLPLHLDGRAGAEAEAARDFAASVGSATGLPVELLDERWTSREAERALRESQPRRRKRERARLDAAAAAILLRTFLAQRTADRNDS
ncbi:MAG: Holliday junction resolvase RuvX [Deltaproteobacteria bacterium]|nr:Holliday junction resolvase RuvX [Deltaproteobacteria bacterium]MBW2360216.1 Holliday junction resolvase RuvX [Deltaproteobacteria bacterium]